MSKVKLINCRFLYYLTLLLFLSVNILSLKVYASQHDNNISTAKNLIKDHSEKVIREFAEQNQWNYVNIETDVWIPEPWIESNPCDGAISVKRGSSRKPWGRVSYEINCINPPWQTRGRSETSVETRAAVSTTLLRRGHTLTANDLTIKKVNLDRSYMKIYPTKDNLIGSRVRRNIRPNDIIDPRFVDKAYLVQEGSPVVLEINQYGIEASMPGIALEDGALGETVTVENQSSGRRVPGTVMDKNKVRVNF